MGPKHRANKLNETAVTFYFRTKNNKLSFNVTATPDSETKAEMWCQIFRKKD